MSKGASHTLTRFSCLPHVEGDLSENFLAPIRIKGNSIPVLWVKHSIAASVNYKSIVCFRIFLGVSGK